MSSAPATLRLPLPGLLSRSLSGGLGGLPLVERNARAYRHLWILLITGVLEPLFYLLSIRIGLGALVGPVYDAALATPLGPGDIALGEITWALSRGLLYAVAFLVVLAAMGLVHSAWVLVAVPASLLISFAFAGIGMAATTYMRSWKDFDFVILATLPMFLFSTTFYPLSVYPRALQIVVECTPLYQAVALLRGFLFGVVGPAMLVNVAYLAVLGLAGLFVASRRLRRLLLT